MTEPMLNEPREWTGKWWLQGDPDNKVPGVLAYSPNDGLRLRLVGGWEYVVKQPGENDSTIITNELRHWPSVLGIGDGKFVTLLDVCVTSANTFNIARMFGVPDKLELSATTALIGFHLADPDDAVFVAGIGQVENLTTWSRRSGIEEKHYFGAKVGELSGQIDLTRLDPLSVDIGPLTATLHHVAWQPFSGESRGGAVVRVREQASIEFSSEEAKPLQHWLDLLGGIADLMSLSTLRACGLITMRVYLPPTPDRFPEDHPLRNERHEIEVYQQLLVTPKPDEKALNQRNLVLTLDDLSFEELLPKWLEVRGTFAAARGMILGLQYVTGGYIETRVVTAVAAAESMHRALAPDPPIPSEEFKQIRETLLAAVPADRKSWLAERLTEQSNVPTLKQRLLSLVDRLGAAGEALVLNREKWANAAKNARNNLVHKGSSEHDLEVLHAVVEVTAGIVILNLLKELGVPEERLTLAVQEQDVLSQAAKLARTLLNRV
ncbi:hypothetical protein GCM10027022_10900 [Alpinimonas psychrophila]|uniref:ApeA N-terminal domain-containing protein n=1 Tax=Alpinimonas psychrophila TaxID=748908 RepID=A0A7W3PP57_9MICO|nr:HEPN domain-containing protein [Alpinimonas psychrophila]MBA8828916.1 hypothetical protein [Alpinimonas psychrophila]